MNVSTAESSTQTHSTSTATFSSQSNLNLKNLTQTEADTYQNDSNNDLPSTIEEDISPIRILNHINKSDKYSPYIHHNIRVVKNLPRSLNLNPNLPKPVSKVQDIKKIPNKVVKTQNSPAEITDVTETPGTENNFKERLKRNEVVHSIQSQLRERDRKPIPRKGLGRKVVTQGVTLSVATDQRQRMLGGLSQMKGLLKQAQGCSGSNDIVKIVPTEENASETNGLWNKFLLCNESLGSGDTVKKTDYENNENFDLPAVDFQILPENIINPTLYRGGNTE